MQHPLILIDRRGAIQSISADLCALLGYAAPELVGRDIVSLVAGETAQAVGARRALLEGAPIASASLALRAKGGPALAVTLSATPLLDARGQVSATACLVAATGQGAFQPAAQQELPILRAALESTADAILVVDERLRVVTCNHKFEELWGLPPGWAASPTYQELLELLKGQVKDPEAFARRVEEIDHEGADSDFELFETRDGRIIERFSSVYSIDGRPGGRVWNYRDRTQLEQAHHEIYALKTLAETLNRALNPHEALDDGLAMVVRLFGAQAGWIRGIEPTGEVSIVSRSLPPEWAGSLASVADRPLCNCLWDICTGHPTATEVCTCEQLGRTFQTAYVTPYQISILVQAGGRTAGIIILLAPEQRAYSDADARLFEAISSHFGLALERARLFAADQDQRRTAEVLYGVTSALNETITIADVLRRVARLSVEALRASGGFIGLLSPDGAELAIADGFNFDPELVRGSLGRGGGLSWSVIESGEPALINEYRGHPRALPEVIALGARACAAVPIAAGGRRLGALTIFSLEPRRRFTAQDLALLASIGKQAGVAIQNARLYEEIQSLAIHDALTGLYNQRYLFSAGEQEFARALRYHHPLSVLLLDVDHFKRVNDTYGHDTGNVVLRAVAEQCRAHLRRSDIVARYGGEEFVMLLVETGLAEALVVAGRLCANIAGAPVATERGAVAVTVSIGVAATGGDDPPDSLAALLQRADMAMYEAKRGGRNRVRASPALP